jgi:hypothetical protein
MLVWSLRNGDWRFVKKSCRQKLELVKSQAVAGSKTSSFQIPDLVNCCGAFDIADKESLG